MLSSSYFLERLVILPVNSQRYIANINNIARDVTVAPDEQKSEYFYSKKRLVYTCGILVS